MLSSLQSLLIIYWSSETFFSRLMWPFCLCCLQADVAISCERQTATVKNCFFPELWSSESGSFWAFSHSVALSLLLLGSGVQSRCKGSIALVEDPQRNPDPKSVEKEKVYPSMCFVSLFPVFVVVCSAMSTMRGRYLWRSEKYSL